MPTLERGEVEPGKPEPIQITLDEIDSKAFLDWFWSQTETVEQNDEIYIDRLIVTKILPSDGTVVEMGFHTIFHETISGFACLCAGVRSTFKLKGWERKDIETLRAWIQKRNEKEDFRAPTSLLALMHKETRSHQSLIQTKIIKPLRDEKQARDNSDKKAAGWGASVADLATETGKNADTVRYHIGKLRTENLIKNTKYYDLQEATLIRARISNTGRKVNNKGRK